MNDPTPNLLIDFDGAVACQRPSGTVNLVLRGRERGSGGVEALFAGAAAEAIGALPPTLHDARLYRDGAGRFRLQASEVQTALTARSLQLHRDAERDFLRAVPPPRVPLRRQLGFTLLLALLRIPGAGALLGRLSGRA